MEALPHRLLGRARKVKMSDPSFARDARGSPTSMPSPLDTICATTLNRLTATFATCRGAMRL
jgi:hypothetical protein